VANVLKHFSGMELSIDPYRFANHQMGLAGDVYKPFTLFIRVMARGIGTGQKNAMSGIHRFALERWRTL